MRDERVWVAAASSQTPKCERCGDKVAAVRLEYEAAKVAQEEADGGSSSSGSALCVDCVPAPYADVANRVILALKSETLEIGEEAGSAPSSPPPPPPNDNEDAPPPPPPPTEDTEAATTAVAAMPLDALMRSATATASVPDAAARPLSGAYDAVAPSSPAAIAATSATSESSDESSDDVSSSEGSEGVVQNAPQQSASAPLNALAEMQKRRAMRKASTMDQTDMLRHMQQVKAMQAAKEQAARAAQTQARVDVARAKSAPSPRQDSGAPSKKAAPEKAPDPGKN